MLQQRIDIARGKFLKLTLQVSFGSLHVSSNMLKASAAYNDLASCSNICAEYRPLLPQAFLLTNTQWQCCHCIALEGDLQPFQLCQHKTCERAPMAMAL